MKTNHGGVFVRSGAGEGLEAEEGEAGSVSAVGASEGFIALQANPKLYRGMTDARL